MRPSAAARIGVACAAIVAATWAAASAFGAAIVTGGSMMPSMWPGDMVVYRRGGIPEMGCAVVFSRRSSGALVVHRVLSHSPGHGYVLRGDANPTPDRDAVPSNSIKGVVVATLPLGRALAAGLGAFGAR